MLQIEIGLVGSLYPCRMHIEIVLFVRVEMQQLENCCSDFHYISCWRILKKFLRPFQLSPLRKFHTTG
jgi:hypothetical protein